MFYSRDIMPKRKPDKVVVHRIELNTFERDLLETALVASISSNIVSEVTPSLVQLIGVLSDPVNLYGFITLLEIAGLIDTPVPTLGDSKDDLRSAIYAIKDFLGFKLDYENNAEANTANAEIAATQARNVVEDKERIRNETSQAYREGNASYEDMMAAQNELGKAQDAKFRAELIAKGWKYKFQLENGRWPTRSEVADAKNAGTYYPLDEPKESWWTRASRRWSMVGNM